MWKRWQPEGNDEWRERGEGKWGRTAAFSVVKLTQLRFGSDLDFRPVR